MFMLLSVSETLVKQSETSETISNDQHLKVSKHLKATSSLMVTVVTVGYSEVTLLKAASILMVTEVTHFFNVLLIYIYYYIIIIYIIIYIIYYFP